MWSGEAGAHFYHAPLQGGGEEKADRDRGAGDQEEGEGVDCHGKARVDKSVKLGRLYPQDWVGAQVRDRKG